MTRETPLAVSGAGAISVFRFDGAAVINGTTTEISADAAAAPGNLARGKINDSGSGDVPGLSRQAGSAGTAASNAASRTSTEAASNASGTAAGPANANSALAAGAAASVVDSVVTTVQSVTDAVPVDSGNSGNGNSGNGNVGGKGIGQALGLKQ